MKIEIDPKAGFCFGVTRVVKKAEEIILEKGSLYCLGEIVHNQKEIERLENIGLKTITHEEFMRLSDCDVLIRAHGEPPETYTYAKAHNINLIDGTCPIVLRLQSKIKKDFNSADKETQIVIFGKKDHAEVRGLAGQTGYNAIIIESADDVKKIDLSRPIHLYAQTTMSSDKYSELQQNILNLSEQAGYKKQPECTNSICRQVSSRIPELKEFCRSHDIIFFVSYKQSSNGKLLYTKCKEVNGNTYFVTSPDEVEVEWLKGTNNIGITGATSTPWWLLNEFAAYIYNLYKTLL